jgi:hypothetical protein
MIEIEEYYLMSDLNSGWVTWEKDKNGGLLKASAGYKGLGFQIPARALAAAKKIIETHGGFRYYSHIQDVPRDAIRQLLFESA